MDYRDELKNKTTKNKSTMEHYKKCHTLDEV